MKLNETLTIVKNGFGHTSYGVNAILDAMTLIGTDARPGHIALVTTEIDDDSTALRLVPASSSSLPAITLTIPRETEIVADVDSDTQDGNVLVDAHLVFYRVDTANAKRAFHYTLDAMRKCMESLIDSSNETDRVLNNLQVVSFADGSHIQVIQQSVNKEDAWITGGLRFMFAVRDLAP